MKNDNNKTEVFGSKLLIDIKCWWCLRLELMTVISNVFRIFGYILKGVTKQLKLDWNLTLIAFIY